MQIKPISLKVLKITPNNYFKKNVTFERFKQIIRKNDDEKNTIIKYPNDFWGVGKSPSTMYS